MVTGFVGLSAQTMHKSVIIAAFFFFLWCDYDANIITLNKETIEMTEMSDTALSLTKAGKHRGITGATRLWG